MPPPNSPSADPPPRSCPACPRSSASENGTIFQPQAMQPPIHRIPEESPEDEGRAEIRATHHPMNISIAEARRRDSSWFRTRLRHQLQTQCEFQFPKRIAAQTPRPRLGTGARPPRRRRRGVAALLPLSPQLTRASEALMTQLCKAAKLNNRPYVSESTESRPVVMRTFLSA